MTPTGFLPPTGKSLRVACSCFAASGEIVYALPAAETTTTTHHGGSDAFVTSIDLDRVLIPDN